MSNFYCQCGGQMRVIDSRPATFASQPSTRRRRKCADCGQRMTTFEISADGPVSNQLAEVRNLIDSEERFRAAYQELMESCQRAQKAQQQSRRAV